MADFQAGARKAWATRRQKGWRRKTNAEWKAELLKLAESKRLGKRQMKLAHKQLTKRYRSKAQERMIIKQWRESLG